MSDTTSTHRPLGKPEHFELLVLGVDKWNQKRREVAFTPDLRGYDVNTGLTKRWELREFESVDLTRVDMKDALLQGASFQRCILDEADFRSADLTCSDLSYASIVGADFHGATLNNAKMANSKCIGTRFSYGALRCASLFEQRMFGPEYIRIDKEIASISDLLDALKELRRHEDQRPMLSSAHSHRTYYRGHSVESWTLTPTAMRRSDDKDDDFESRMLTELISDNPSEFADDSSLLSQLVKAREFGLPTRLLDISSDPLVALFFAVQNQKWDKHNGALHVFGVPLEIMKSFGSDAVAVVCAYARLSSRDQRMLIGEKGFTEVVSEITGDKSQKSRVIWRDVTDRIVNEITKEGRGFTDRIDLLDLFRVFVVLPKIDERRLRQQSGAFLLSAFHKSFELETVRANMPNVPMYNHYQLTIEAGAKPEIRKELEHLNITRESLLSSLEVSAESIRQRYGFE